MLSLCQTVMIDIAGVSATRCGGRDVELRDRLSLERSAVGVALEHLPGNVGSQHSLVFRYQLCCRRLLPCRLDSLGSASQFCLHRTTCLCVHMICG